MHCELKLKKGIEKKVMHAAFRAFVLWLISTDDMHGYEIIKKLRVDSGMPNIGASRIYPLLSKLTNDGMITQKKKMDGKRIKKVYAITKKGILVLKAARSHLHSSPLRLQYLRYLVEC
ncbi:PadR family transcriptional regulator [Candidatus Micrarchaeota archaeon]|nr:PadR family transcriptional regulator [Candidatus Micrarchaeota archaeon]MBU1165912.1 PadR family transcriptional regulator [Candidatus Micrarchaeota archaeon]MBU1886789.1 PadR family transcriptional regulator [Candidatus Micrarchaeota archaeon]